MKPISTIAIQYEHDVVLARQRARQIAGLLGFDHRDQVRIATAVSEIARNAFRYAKGGRVEFAVTGNGRQSLQITVRDKGPGILRLQEVLNGQYVSKTGMGLGIVGAKRLMDSFEIDSNDSGTRVVLGKELPVANKMDAAQIAREISQAPPQDPFEELQRQNQELISTLEELQRQKAELAVLNKELEDTNRGVVALYAELDERADYFRRASELKTQFLSNMTHEFRTPLNSMLSLTRILLDRLDGDLTAEQEKQVRFIQRAAGDLSELVNDLLDLAKVEAGKVVIRPGVFRVQDLFGALRGMLRPLLAHNTAVTLAFEAPPDLEPVNTDESKVSQVLRNLISNALKYTEQGVVTVSARPAGVGWINFDVSDTGIGIEPKDQERIFEDFVQVEGHHQRGKRGTGLGLPLSRKLAELLGGSLTVQSEPGKGSCFTLRLPMCFPGSERMAVEEIVGQVEPGRVPVLVIEDNAETRAIYERFLSGTRFQSISVRSLIEAREVLERLKPAAVVLDILLANESGWSFLTEFKHNEATRTIPVLIITMLENEDKAFALGANAFHTKPVTREWLLDQLGTLCPEPSGREVLVVDDDEASRYVVKGLLAELGRGVIEASAGVEGLRLARERKPAAIFLDLGMPGMSGFQVLAELKGDPVTDRIPVVIHTCRRLTAEERDTLSGQVVRILDKNHSDREVSKSLIRQALGQAAEWPYRNDS